MIKLWVADYRGVDANNIQHQVFPRILKPHFDLKFTPDKPDYLIYSCWGQDFLEYHCPRIFCTEENLYPDPTECDFSFSFDLTTERNYRFPYYMYSPLRLEYLGDFHKPRDADSYLAHKNKFCNFTQSNPCGYERNIFYVLLSKYKKVDATGRLFNSGIGPIPERKVIKFDKILHPEAKIEALRSYKFAITFENASYPGYTTEKIVDAFAAGAVPIYFGNPDIAQEFNPASFINCHDFDTFDDVVEHIIEVDNNDKYYRQYLEAPPFLDNKFVENLMDGLVARFRHIFESDIPNPLHTSAYNRFLCRMPKRVAREIIRYRRRVFKRHYPRLWRKMNAKVNKHGKLLELAEFMARKPFKIKSRAVKKQT